MFLRRGMPEQALCVRVRTCVLVVCPECYNTTMSTVESLVNTPGRAGKLLGVDDAFDYFVFHSPYNKLVQQSFSRILFNDVRRAVAVSVRPFLCLLLPQCAFFYCGVTFVLLASPAKCSRLLKNT